MINNIIMESILIGNNVDVLIHGECVRLILGYVIFARPMREVLSFYYVQYLIAETR
jgi:hypothetical protein